MPISRRVVEHGDPSTVLDFLRSNWEHAYSVEEIVAALTPTGLKTNEIEEDLQSRVDDRRVETRNSGGVIYYMYVRRIGFRPS